MGELDLSVIIAARDAAATIGAQLTALTHESWQGDWEVIVADNGSIDATRDVVRSFSATDSRVRLVDASGTPGAAHARNRGMDAAKGRAFAFCDADDVVQEGWVSAIGGALARHDLVTGPIAVDLLNPAWLRTAFYARMPTAAERFADIFPFGSTCNLGVSRRAIKRVGGFDPSYLTGQDLELCMRCWEAGIELAYVPDAVVQYRYRADLPALWHRSRRYGSVGPRLARRLAAAGGPAPSHWGGLRQWLWLVRKLTTLRTKAGRARWLVVAGGKIGRLQGSWRARWLYL